MIITKQPPKKIHNFNIFLFKFYSFIFVVLINGEKIVTIFFLIETEIRNLIIVMK